jgi:fructokinase
MSGIRADTCCKLSQEYSIELVCVTRGANGCAAYHNGKWHVFPGIAVQVADTVGAGDAFSAALLSLYCQSGKLMESMILANRLGAFVASRSGALPDYDNEISQLFQKLQ